MGNISSLVLFSATYNNLGGNVPDEFGRLESLTFFALGSNGLSGTIPLFFYNLSSARTLISITDNTIIGNIPPTIGFTLPNLRWFAVGGTSISGVIPQSISISSQLQTLDLSRQQFFWTSSN